MKLLVFSHIPPPHHGQSYMVKLMLDAFGGDQRKAGPLDPRPSTPGSIECYHVNARFSEDMEDIGSLRFEKAMLVLQYCLEAIWCRFRYGIDAFYYVPAPGKHGALFRDWIVMLLCRPFFKKTIFHWHAVGLGDWVRGEGLWVERWISRWLLNRPALSIVLAISSMRDALWFKTREVAIVPNGIPDPRPDFDSQMLPRREARRLAREKLLQRDSLTSDERSAAGGDPDVFKVIYLAHCTREKGLFDTLDAVALANSELITEDSKLRIVLTVAGNFMEESERAEFEQRIARDDLSNCVYYAGFVEKEAKEKLLNESDCFCFPTYYPAEGQPVNLIEALAFGLAVITTNWRAIPEILPPGYSGFVHPGRPREIAEKFRVLITHQVSTVLRKRFLENFTEDRYIQNMAMTISGQAQG